MEIRVLDKDTMKQVFSMKDAIQADKDAMEMYASGKTDIPLRANLHVPEYEGDSLYMYGYAGPANALGVKIVSVFPNNAKKGIPSVPATMVLLNNETGEVSALLDGTYLTAVRTGALAGAATDLLAKKDAKTFALIGIGGQAEGQLEAVLCVRDIETVKVCGRNFEKAKTFAAAMQEKFGEKYQTNIVAVETSKEAIEDADVITTVTTSLGAVIDGHNVKAGAHINAMGSYTPEMAEIDEYTVMRASKVYVDTRDGALSEAGDLLQPIANGTFAAEDVVGDLGEVVLGKVPVRENEEEITLFDSVGTAVLDIVTAKRILECAEKKDMGIVIQM